MLMDLTYLTVTFLLFLPYLWVLYNTPILAFGIRRMRLLSRKRRKEKVTIDQSNLPTVSIVVPVKDEERVVGRLLRSLIRLDYPPEKREIIIVEDASTDKTFEICQRFADRYPDSVKFFHRDFSNGKPSALNY